MDNIIEIFENVGNIVDDLFLSFKKEEVEDVFAKNSIADRSLRIQLLRKCMHVRDTSNTNEVLSMDDDYNDELVIFLNETWRMLV